MVSPTVSFVCVRGLGWEVSREADVCMCVCVCVRVCVQAVLKGDLSRMRPGRGFGVGEDGREMDGLADVKEQAILT